MENKGCRQSGILVRPVSWKIKSDAEDEKVLNRCTRGARMPTRNLYIKLSKKLKGKEPILVILIALLFISGFLYIKELTGIAGNLWFITIGLLMVLLMARLMINPDGDYSDKTEDEFLAVLMINVMIIFGVVFWFIY